MCGIFGFSGKQNASDLIKAGLTNLEYRGYDSWGVAVLATDEIKIEKEVGAISDVNHFNLPESGLGIGHMRWATHGGVTQTNAHPHLASNGRFALAQNGIVENFQELKTELSEKGHAFITETDTEVIVRLIEEELKHEQEFVTAVVRAFKRLTGRNTIILLDKLTKQLVGIKYGSPMIAGENSEGEYFVSSDTLALSVAADTAYVLENEEVVVINADGMRFYNLTLEELKKERTAITEQYAADKEGFEHFMIKEIVAQQHTIAEATNIEEAELAKFTEALLKAEHIYTLGSGTASFAAGQTAYYIRSIAGQHATELKAYEMDSYQSLFTERDIVIAFSQSGETADTIEALEIAKAGGARVASFVNMIGSTIPRMSDFSFATRVGPEICVASTKVLTAQIAWGYLVAMTLSGQFAQAKANLLALTNSLEDYFTEDLFTYFRNTVKDFIKNEHFFVMGTGQNYYIALEGALKIKEITYKHVEGFSSSELKHGVIALIEEGTPTFIIVDPHQGEAVTINAASEVKARGARVIGVSPKANAIFDYHLPTAGSHAELNPILNVIPFQLFSYFLAVELNLPPDKPRNLAKSVTVK